MLVFQQRSQTALRHQNQLLKERLEQLAFENDSLSNRLREMSIARLPALHARGVQIVTPEPSKDASATNLIARLLNGGELPPLSVAQLARYLDENHQSAASLLSAYRVSRDSTLLKEAMEKYPHNPEVTFEAVFQKDASPAERRGWLEAFKSAAPENALPTYLSALDYFNSGQTNLAVQELGAAAGRQQFTDYTAERIQNDEEAYRAAGYSEGDAKMAANYGLVLPQLGQMKGLSQQIVGLAAGYRQGGDENSAQAALQMGMDLGKQLDSPPGNSTTLIAELVGIAIERLTLSSMDPASAYGDGTVQQQLDQLAQRRTSIKDLVTQSNPFRDQMSPEEWLSYNERTRSFGEENAIKWLLNKYGQK
jgi:hypothetical protein